MPRPVTIAGGGLAGLTLALLLRRSGVSVEVVEAAHYPRHRVCGEFVNGRGLDVLRSLGLQHRLRDAGAREATTALFCTPSGRGPVRPLPQPALCVSRFVFDQVLAEALIASGGRLTTGHRWTDSFATPGVVRATGRRPPPHSGESRWFGYKAHARGIDLDADLEMHLGPRGYVGLCRVEDGRVNACGLFRAPAASGETAARLAEGITARLQARLGGAEWDPASICAIGGLPLHRGLLSDAAAGGDCAVGDAAAMIPPLTGNGMSMALESAALAAGPLTDYARGAGTWAECRRAVTQRQQRAFGARLARANGAHRFLFAFPGALWLVPVLLRSRIFWGVAFRGTR